MCRTFCIMLCNESVSIHVWTVSSVCIGDCGRGKQDCVNVYRLWSISRSIQRNITQVLHFELFHQGPQNNKKQYPSTYLYQPINQSAYPSIHPSTIHLSSHTSIHPLKCRLPNVVENTEVHLKLLKMLPSHSRKPHNFPKTSKDLWLLKSCIVLPPI